MLASLIRGALFSVAAIVGPGIAAQRFARVPVDPALVLPLGSAAAAALYWASLVLHVPWLFPAGILAFDLALLVPLGAWTRAPGPSLRAALLPLAALVALLAATQYGWNRYGPAGEFILDPLVPFDTGFHVGLTRELTLGYPPQVPGVSGFPLGYHLGADLVRAAALRWAHVDPYDQLTRIDPTLGALALVLLLRSIAQRLGAGRFAVALVPWTLLATDFSFLFGGYPSAHWWTDLLRGNLLISLCLANPVVPALALTLGALLALARYESGEGRGWLALAALQALALPFFKVFLGAHLLLGLGAALLLRRRLALLLVAAPLLIATAALALGQGSKSVELALAPLDLVRITRESLGLLPLEGIALAAWSLLWLAASLGLRVFGLAPALRALHRGPAFAVALATIALSAWPLGLLFRVSAPEALAGQKLVNDAAYLLEEGGPLLWIFAILAIVPLLERRRAWLLAVMALSLPSTGQFVWQKNRWPNDAIPASVVRATRAVEAVSQPGDVILQRPGGRFPPAPVLLSSRRVPYERFTPWLTQFASREALEARHAVVYTFFRTNDSAEARRIAASLGARYVCLYGAERVRFDTAGMFQSVYEEPEARVYRILD